MGWKPARRPRQPFHIIRGGTGALLMRALDSSNQQAVILDIDPERISELELGQYHLKIPALTGRDSPGGLVWQWRRTGKRRSARVE